MEIKTKYNLGQRLWVALGNTIRRGCVSSIDIHSNKRRTEVVYNVNIRGNIGSFPECELYVSETELKEELKMSRKEQP